MEIYKKRNATPVSICISNEMLIWKKNLTFIFEQSIFYTQIKKYIL